MAASDPRPNGGSGTTSRRAGGAFWATQAAWAASGALLAVIVFELLDLRSDDERFAEFILSARQGRVEAVGSLLAEGVDPARADGDAWTALHHAAYYGRRDVVEVLLAHGAPVGARHPHGWTPLHRAAEHGSVEIARLLVGRGADLDAPARGRTPLGVAISKRHDPLVLYFVEQGADLGELDARSGLTPVLYAVMSGEAELLRAMIARGGGVDATLRNGESALHLAVAGGQADLAALLLEAGADVDRANARGETPLHHAARAGSAEIAEVLLAAGADPGRRDADGRLPRERLPEGFDEAVARRL